MKVPVNDYACLNLDAPTLPAHEAVIDGSVYWLVWCEHCSAWHRHGQGEGHRESHCTDEASPYWLDGYNLAYAGQLSEHRP